MTKTRQYTLDAARSATIIARRTLNIVRDMETPNTAEWLTARRAAMRADELWSRLPVQLRPKAAP